MSHNSYLHRIFLKKKIKFSILLFKLFSTKILNYIQYGIDNNDIFAKSWVIVGYSYKSINKISHKHMVETKESEKYKRWAIAGWLALDSVAMA